MKATRFLYFDLNSKVIVTSMSTHVTYESNYIFLLLDSTMSYVLNFWSFYLFYCNLKEKEPIRRKTDIKKMFIWEISINIILICQKLGLISTVQQKNRSSWSEVFCKKGVLRNFVQFTGKHLCQSLFFNKVTGLSPAPSLKKRLWQGVFLWLLQTSKNTISYRTPPVAASEKNKLAAPKTP